MRTQQHPASLSAVVLAPGGLIASAVPAQAPPAAPHGQRQHSPPCDMYTGTLCKLGPINK